MTQIEPDHPDGSIAATLLLMEALGTTDQVFMEGILEQLANAGTQGRVVDEHGLNDMLAVVVGIEPKDHVEAMLAAQMAAVHNATMTFARTLRHVENIPQQDSAGSVFNKLARTFAAQVEALKRYRTGGEQRVTVEHVTVSEGGQAVVGNVQVGVGGEEEIFIQSTCAKLMKPLVAEQKQDRVIRVEVLRYEKNGAAGCTVARIQARRKETATP